MEIDRCYPNVASTHRCRVYLPIIPFHNNVSEMKRSLSKNQRGRNRSAAAPQSATDLLSNKAVKLQNQVNPVISESSVPSAGLSYNRRWVAGWDLHFTDAKRKSWLDNAEALIYISKSKRVCLLYVFCVLPSVSAIHFSDLSIFFSSSITLHLSRSF